MSDPYIPRSELGLVDWLTVFSGNITLNPSAVGLAISDANTIAAAVADFLAKRAIVINDETRTPVAIEEKDVSRNSCVQLCRGYAMIIRNNNGVTDAAKIAVGVRPINPDREPIFVPGTQPNVEVLATTNGLQTLEITETGSPKKSLPFGAASIQVYVHVGDAINTDPDEARFIGNFTKNPIIVAYDHSENAKVATYFARWCGRRGDVGPWSTPESQAIAA